ncbi:MAG: hypothetical protein KY476_09430, partial [Planctomycetes bacterium]|nr:hypothetical protein [Planctomycetota bacterium]
QSYYDRIMPLYQNFQALREQKATAAAWTKWQRETNAELATFLDDLAETAGSQPDKLARQHMLLAARDELPMLLKDSKEKPGRREQRFLYHMDAARRLIAGLPPAAPSSSGGPVATMKDSDDG